MKHHYNKEELTELKRKYDMQVNKEAIEEIKHTIDLDKEIERLQKILRTRARQDRKRKAKVRVLREEITNKNNKLERLNNIITELEKWLNELQEERLYIGDRVGVVDSIKLDVMIDKLKELKENSK